MTQFIFAAHIVYIYLINERRSIDIELIQFLVLESCEVKPIAKSLYKILMVFS